MADTATFESPITRTYQAKPDAPVVLTDESSQTKLVVRADDDSAAASRLAVDFGSSRTSDQVLVLGQRPGEWLLVGDEHAVRSFVSTLDRTGHVSLIDHTHSRALFMLRGEGCRSVLEKICGLDLHDDMTPDGAVVSASVAKVTCDIARHDLEDRRAYLVACDRSFGQYLFDAVIDAGDEFGIGVGR